jgi:hypothetical protein
MSASDPGDRPAFALRAATIQAASDDANDLDDSGGGQMDNEAMFEDSEPATHPFCVIFLSRKAISDQIRSSHRILAHFRTAP